MNNNDNNNFVVVVILLNYYYFRSLVSSPLSQYIEKYIDMCANANMLLYFEENGCVFNS